MTPSTVEVSAQPDRTRRRVVGSFDRALRDRFQVCVASVMCPRAAIDLDLRDVCSIDAVGLSAVLATDRAARALPGVRLRVLISDEGSVRRMFELTLLHLSLDICTAG